MNSDSEPRGWRTETPRYRATKNVHPSPNPRHRLEPPFSAMWDSDTWQYAEHEIAAGQEFSSTAFPHPSFVALNYSGERVLQFFKGAMKSRLGLSPFRNGRIELSDGLSGDGLIRPLMPSEGGTAV